jgi:hypothetical protein
MVTGTARDKRGRGSWGPTTYQQIVLCRESRGQQKAASPWSLPPCPHLPAIVLSKGWALMQRPFVEALHKHKAFLDGCSQKEGDLARLEFLLRKLSWLMSCLLYQVTLWSLATNSSCNGQYWKGGTLTECWWLNEFSLNECLCHILQASIFSKLNVYHNPCMWVLTVDQTLLLAPFCAFSHLTVKTAMRQVHLIISLFQVVTWSTERSGNLSPRPHSR